MEKVTVPVEARACRIPTDAEELCRIVVTRIPNRTARNGLRNMVNRFINCSESFKGPSAVSMVDIPTNRMPNPTKIEAIPRVFFFLEQSRTNAPIITSAGAKEDGFSKERMELPVPFTSARRRICAVTVVPIFAPIITGIACTSFMIPAFTKPTSMIVVAPELWITAVTPVPRRNPFSLLLVRRSSVRSRLPPAICCSDELKRFIPYKNRPMPPISDKIICIFILSSCNPVMSYLLIFYMDFTLFLNITYL